MTRKCILPVENNPQDEILILRARKRINLANTVDVVRDGAQAVNIPSSSDTERDRLKSYLNGANSFVRKPLDFAEFAETLAQLGIHWRATNEAP